jgi:GTP-binding protein YchF
MQLALVGLPGAGIKTVFSAITGLGDTIGHQGAFGQNRLAVLKVPDDRLDFISRIFRPPKAVQATVEIAEFPGLFGRKVDAASLARVREADALTVVIRAFPSAVVPHPLGNVDPVRDLNSVLSELLLADLAIVEARLHRLEASLKKRKDEEEQEEKEVLEKCKLCLDRGEALRQLEMDSRQQKVTRGFGFLTRKPLIILLNIGDSQLEQEESLMGPLKETGFNVRTLCGDIEAELAQMGEGDRRELMTDFGIEELAAPIVLGAAYQTLDLVTFYTHSEKECRAWHIHMGETALDAAAKVHTDLARGFIRAEVVGFEDLQTYQSIKEVKAHGRLRLEGKDYVVQDGDLITVRHSG